MIDSHALLELKIEGLVKKDGVDARSVPMMPWWSGDRTTGKKRNLAFNDEAGSIEVGHAGYKRRLLGGIASRGEHVYWVTDHSVEPPVTYLLHDTMMGAFVNVGNAMNEQPNSKDNVYSKLGDDIVKKMHELLSEHGKPVEVVSCDPASSLVAGI